MPVEEWEDRQKEDSEIDLVELAHHIWGRRRFVAKVTGVFVVIGLLIALLSPVEYQVEATLLPEAQSMQGGVGSLLEQYGGLLGMSGSMSLDQEGTIPPQLYPNIVQSLPFQLELLNTRVTFSEFDTTTTVYAFFDEIYTPSVFSYVKGYTVGLPGKIMGMFKDEAPEQPLPKGFGADSIVSVTQSQMKIIESMRERMTINLDEESGTLTLTAKMPDPQAAAEVGQAGIVLIKEYIENYRTRKATQNLEFVEEQMARAKERFEQVQNRLTEFRDSNVILTTAKAQAEEQRLQAEFDLAFNVYNTLAQQVEQAKLKVQEDTPVVSVLQPIQMPLVKSEPQRKLIVIGFLFLGGFLSLVYVGLGHLLKDRIDLDALP